MVASAGPGILRPASSWKSVEHKGPRWEGAAGLWSMGRLHTSALFSLYDLDRIAHPLLAALSTTVKWDDTTFLAVE